MRGYIPNGMVKKQLLWEKTNTYLYELMMKESSDTELKPFLIELNQLQENQNRLLYQLNDRLIRSEEETLESFDHHRDIQDSIKEMYDREYELLQEYKSIYGYFLVDHPLQKEIIQIIMLQQKQVNLLIQLKNALSESSTSSPKKSYVLEDGYVLEKVKGNLNFPTSICFDETGSIYIAESGFVYGKPPGEGRILHLQNNGELTEFAKGFGGPLTGMTYQQGVFYVAAGNRAGKGENPCGSIFKVKRNGEIEEIVTGLATCGDHFTGDIVVGPDEKLYFGVGTATNSAVVGPDNRSWLKLHQNFHDTPARDIIVTGQNFISKNPISEKDKIDVTGPFKPFGESAEKNEVIKGNLYANGVLYRCNQDGSGLEIIADGFRNPFGVQFSPFSNHLYITNAGADPRGSRQLSHDWDTLWTMDVTAGKGNWYGWPDFYSGLPVTLSHFQVDDQMQTSFILRKHPKLASSPLVRLETHSSSNKFDFSRNVSFGHVGEVFIAQTGDMGFEDPDQYHGYQVVRVNEKTGQIRAFLKNPVGEQTENGPVRPIEAKFSLDGAELYVLDIGYIGGKKKEAKNNTGALWKIKRK